MILLLSFNWERTVSRVPQARRSEGHGTSWHKAARLRRAWTSIFGNYAHSRRPWRASTDRQPEGTLHSIRPLAKNLRHSPQPRRSSFSYTATPTPSRTSPSAWPILPLLGHPETYGESAFGAPTDALASWRNMPPSPSACHPSPLAERH